ncbi:MAG: metallophosphoesterase N-terminal domain-containing protein [Mucinivorans sp.]
MKKIVFAIILTIISFQVMAQVSGSVCDENQRPIVGAVLSDGWNCVATDAAGRFVLPSNPKARFVSLTKPALWRTVGGAPYYIKINKGASYNFTLEKSPNEAGSNISFIHITDVESFAHKAWIDNIKEWVATHPTAFIVNTGDICYARGLATNGTLVRSPDMGTDMFYTVGNHDLVAGEYGEKMFEQYFGPAYAANAWWRSSPKLHQAAIDAVDQKRSGAQSTIYKSCNVQPRFVVHGRRFADHQWLGYHRYGAT